MSHKYDDEKKNLLLAFITGLCLSGTWDALFNQYISFSIFPIIGAALAIYCLRNSYIDRIMSDGIPSLMLISFLLGWLLESVIIRVSYPQIGSNFLLAILCLILLFIFIYKWKKITNNS